MGERGILGFILWDGQERELSCLCSPGAGETEVVTRAGREHANCWEGIKDMELPFVMQRSEVEGGRLGTASSWRLELGPGRREGGREVKVQDPSVCKAGSW